MNPDLNPELEPAGRTATIADVRANLDDIRARIRGAGGDPDAVRVLAVTKAFGPEVARVALAAGLHDLGENYAQELVAKDAALRSDRARDPAGEQGDRPHPAVVAPTWHFLGRLQTNKVRSLAGIVGLWQSVDRVELVRQLASRAPGASILVQINLSGEEQKGGCTFDDAPALVAAAQTEGLAVRGLMGVAPAGPPDATRPGFTRLVAIADELGLRERSLGMSDDFEVAVQEGSTMIRIGRGLFGPRPPREVT